MDRVEEGVANFRDFQVTARDFFIRADTRAEEVERQRNKRDQEIKDALLVSNDHITQSASKRSLIWQIAGVFVAIAAVVVSILAVCATLYIGKHADLDPMTIFHLNDAGKVYAASNSQISHIPPVR